jgi:hypothetical protein
MEISSIFRLKFNHLNITDRQIWRDTNFMVCKSNTNTLMLIYLDLYTEISGQNGKEL